MSTPYRSWAGTSALALLGLLQGGIAMCQDQWTLSSPDGRIAITAKLAASKAAADRSPVPGKLCYSVACVTSGGRQPVLGESPLGLVREDQAFAEGLSFVSAGDVATIDESYELPHGKRKVSHVRAREQTLTFRNPQGAPLQLVLRASDEGVAFRYVFPNKDATVRRVREELTGCAFPRDTVVWAAPFQEPGTYTPAYENDYVGPVPVGTPCPTSVGWALPALFRTGACWALVTEAAVDGTFCGMRLASESPGGTYRFRWPEAAEGAGTGSVQPAAALPWTMPWRVIMVGEQLSKLVESTFVNDLNPPSRVADTSWIRPGRVAWSWWSDHDSPRDFEKQREFIDLAAEMRWEYYLVDANWTLMDGGNVRQLIDYGKQRGVGVLLWYNSGGEHNVVTEKPRGCMKAREVRRFEFDMLRRWGAKGVKIDFFQSDKQDIMGLYHEILQDAADYQMLVNFHGCTLPRGWSRTWPHLVSMEAVKGEECYSFDKRYPEAAPRYNTLSVFIRNVVGPVDLTPSAFSDSVYPHLTSNAHELALPVVLECGLVHFADSVQSYRSLPDGPRNFLRDVPATWDDTRLLAGEPGQYAVVARRSGADWFVGAINGENQPRACQLSCNFLGTGTFTAQIIGDGSGPREFSQREQAADRNTTIPLHFLPYGGAAVRFQRQPSP